MFSVGMHHGHRQRRVMQVHVFFFVIAGRADRAVSGRGPFQPGVGQSENLLPGIG
jgi:hypothetical protein